MNNEYKLIKTLQPGVTPPLPSFQYHHINAGTRILWSPHHYHQYHDKSSTYMIITQICCLCLILSIDRGNPQNRYTINNEALISSEYRKKVSGFSSDVSLRKQCIEASNEANRKLGYIFRSAKSRSLVILKLYLGLVRPHLDYVIRFWSLNYRKDIDVLESVQRGMLKRIQGLRNVPYEARLKVVNFHSLDWRGT